jgi:hypothetical protein
MLFATLCTFYFLTQSRADNQTRIYTHPHHAPTPTHNQAPTPTHTNTTARATLRERERERERERFRARISKNPVITPILLSSSVLSLSHGSGPLSGCLRLSPSGVSPSGVLAVHGRHPQNSVAPRPVSPRHARHSAPLHTHAAPRTRFRLSPNHLLSAQPQSLSCAVPPCSSSPSHPSSSHSPSHSPSSSPSPSSHSPSSSPSPSSHSPSHSPSSSPSPSHSPSSSNSGSPSP